MDEASSSSQGGGRLSAKPTVSEDVQKGMEAGNIILDKNEELMPLSKRSAKVLDDHNNLLEGLQRKKRARLLVVPTDDLAVRRRLREIEEPITLFGEGPVDRRKRLRHILAALDKEGTLESFTSVVADEEETKKEQAVTKKQVWYHKGPDELADARKAFARYSLSRAKARLAAEQTKDQMDPVRRVEATEAVTAVYNKLKTYGNNASFIGDTRPISYCRYSPDGSLIATASWSGECKLWSADNFKLKQTYPGKEQWACCVEFHPESTTSLSPDSANLASCGVDGQVHFWSLTSNTALQSLESVGCRLSRLRWYPDGGRQVAAGCWDGTWRMWDVETKQEILYQEGHTRPVYEVDFHPDGSLCASAGLEGIARVWDIRSGRSIFSCEGHVGQVLSVSWAPNGYLLATCGDDNTVKMWDIRKRQEAYTLVGHKSVVSAARFEKKQGNYLMTSCYDNTAILWAVPSMVPINTFKGHESKVMCCDIAPDGTQMVTSSYDRTVKVWRANEFKI